jgi:DUF4097 and DUF4098 domain-containing protein YvlB
MTKGLVAVSILGLAAVMARADEWNKQWQVHGTPEVHISAGDASIAVEAGSNGSVEANLSTRGWTIGDSGIRVIEHQSGDRIDLEIKEPNTHFSFGEHSAHLTVRVPRKLTGYIHTGDGSVKLKGLHGSVRADTGDGSIEADDLDGMLQARSGDGSMHLRGRFDGLQVHTSDGSVELKALEGSKMRADWTLQTGDGSVRLELPKDLAANLSLHTGDGSIRMNMDVTVNGHQNEHEVRGKLNGGGPQLAVSTGDGSIQIDSI